jgi:hypothetical protein
MRRCNFSLCQKDSPPLGRFAGKVVLRFEDVMDRDPTIGLITHVLVARRNAARHLGAA